MNDYDGFMMMVVMMVAAVMVIRLSKGAGGKQHRDREQHDFFPNHFRVPTQADPGPIPNNCLIHRAQCLAHHAMGGWHPRRAFVAVGSAAPC